jgi:hypothetical protein
VKELIPSIRRQIDDNLRLIYRQCLDEGIPGSLQALVDQFNEDSNFARKAGHSSNRSLR